MTEAVAAVINELGYPCRQQLLSWYREFLENDREIGRYALMPNYDHSMRRADDDYFFKHGQCQCQDTPHAWLPDRI